MRLVPLAAPWICLLLYGSALADDAPQAVPRDALLDAAVACPVTLGRALGATYLKAHRPLRAEFVLDTDDRLILRALLEVTANEERSFVEWMGPVHEGGWIPRRRVLADEGEVAEAVRLRALLEPASDALRQALRGAVQTDEDPSRPAEVAISVRPVSREGASAVSLRVGIDGATRGLAYDPAASIYSVEAAGEAPERVPRELRTLPPLEVPESHWFNVEEAPSFEAWRGHPVLVLVTDPG